VSVCLSLSLPGSAAQLFFDDQGAGLKTKDAGRLKKKDSIAPLSVVQ
jgi:hypothetical protein